MTWEVVGLIPFLAATADFACSVMYRVMKIVAGKFMRRMTIAAPRPATMPLRNSYHRPLDSFWGSCAEVGGGSGLLGLLMRFD